MCVCVVGVGWGWKTFMRTQKLNKAKPMGKVVGVVIIRTPMNMVQGELKQVLVYEAGASPDIHIQMKSSKI